MSFLSGGAGAILGGIAGSQRDSGQDVGSNIFAVGNLGPAAEQAYQRVGPSGLISTANYGMQLANDNTLANSTSQVQNNGMLGGMFGQGGTLDRTVSQEKDLSGRGFSLQPEDYEAYGQASGDIARQFGQNEQSLSQALSDRGLSSSGVAGNAFAGSMGNKNEQLSKIQMGIAQQRMQMNQERLNSTRQFMGQMGAQAQYAIGQANNIQSRQANDNVGLASGYMRDLQGVNQQAYKDRQDSMGPSQLSNFITGATGGASSGMKMFSSMSGGKSGGFAGADPASAASMFA